MRALRIAATYRVDSFETLRQCRLKTGVRRELENSTLAEPSLEFRTVASLAVSFSFHQKTFLVMVIVKFFAWFTLVTSSNDTTETACDPFFRI
jgi:hypothetical protein